jgi:hypothetical protein
MRCCNKRSNDIKTMTERRLIKRETMKKLLSLMIMVVLTLSVMPMVLADGDDVSGGVNVDIDDPNNAPEIYTDPTDRSWYPNDQTYYTAELYSEDSGTNLFGDYYYDNSIRGDYVFAGETVTYYVAVYDEDGEDDIDSVILQRDGSGVGSCGQIDESAWGLSDGDANTAFSIPAAIAYDSSGGDANDDLWAFYSCVLIIQDGWSGASEVNVAVSDEAGASSTTVWSDFLTMNPPLSLTLTGSIDFGSAEAGDTVTSSTVQLNNVGSDGVVMDTYIASDDYFTDPINPAAICGTGNGIPYTAFSYYATKGAVDSGSNNNAWVGLGESGSWGPAGAYDCSADADEFTPLPSHSGEINDMCRIINHGMASSSLIQGQSMSLTFQLDVPTPCEGSFTDGEFHFVGRVV